MPVSLYACLPKRAHFRFRNYTFSTPYKFFFFFFFFFLGAHARHMYVPRLEIQQEPPPPAYSTAIAMQDLSCVCDLHCSSWQCRNLNPLSETRYWTCILVDPSWVHYPWSTTELPLPVHLYGAMFKALHAVVLSIKHITGDVDYPFLGRMGLSMSRHKSRFKLGLLASKHLSTC